MDDVQAALVSVLIAEQVARAVQAERERCAALATRRAEHHRDYCRPECRCADGWHIAAAILADPAPVAVWVPATTAPDTPSVGSEP